MFPIGAAASIHSNKLLLKTGPHNGNKVGYSCFSKIMLGDLYMRVKTQRDDYSWVVSEQT